MSTTISGTSGVTFPDSTSMQTGQQACKAWVNFNGTGTVAIRASFNVASITDNGQGSYTVNFTTAMPDANYSLVGNAGKVNGNSSDIQVRPTNMTSSSSCTFTVGTYLTGLSNQTVDQDYISVAIFR